MKKTKKAIIFGTGPFGEVVDFYLTHDSEYEVVGFTGTSGKNSDEYKMRPFKPFDKIEDFFSPETHEMFIAIGCSKMNDVRHDFCFQASQKGYQLLSYICSKATNWLECRGSGNTVGKNVFIFEDNTIQPFVTIGDGTILWSGNHIGHHSKIGEYCFITSHVVVSGSCSIGDSSFIGVNATLRDGISIGKKNLIGPEVYISHDTQDGDVYLLRGPEKHHSSSDRFFQ